MALRAIRINNDPILKRPCREVPQVDDRVRQLLDDMLETLHATANERPSPRRRWAFCAASSSSIWASSSGRLAQAG